MIYARLMYGLTPRGRTSIKSYKNEDLLLAYRPFSGLYPCCTTFFPVFEFIVTTLQVMLHRNQINNNRSAITKNHFDDLQLYLTSFLRKSIGLHLHSTVGLVQWGGLISSLWFTLIHQTAILHRFQSMFTALRVLRFARYCRLPVLLFILLSYSCTVKIF